MNRTHLSFLLLCIVGYANALVGITIKSMYQPDSCGAACFSYFEDFSFTCSTIVDGEISTSSECLSSSRSYMNSVAWCWELQCTYKTDCTTNDFIKVWDKTLPDANISYFDALSLGKPTISLSSSSDINLTESALVNDTLFYIYYRTNKDFLDSETYHARMALSLVMITWALVFFGMFYNVVDKFHLDERYLPKRIRIWFRKYLLFPALFKEKCSVPIRLSEGFPIDYIPPRIVTITIFCYYVINIIFCAVPYRGFWEFQWYPHDTASLMYTYVGNRTGILSFANIPILIIFASRNNIFQWLTGWSYATFQHFHRHVSVICVLEAFVHSVCYTIKYIKKPNSSHDYAVEAAKPYFWWGILATTACCLMPPFAILKLRITSYEIFIFSHYVLAILFVLGCTYHIKDRFSTEWGYDYWLYCSYAIWGFDFFVRILRCVYLKIKGCKNNAIVELVDMESKTIKITYDIGDSTQNCIGNYYYLYFFTLFPFFTSHPFTIAEWNNTISYKQDSLLNKNNTSESDNDETEKETDKESEKNLVLSNHNPDSHSLSFYIQCMNGTTKKIFNKLAESNFEPITISSVLEGPYGSYEREIFHDYDFLILLTGGIGNTVIINYLQCFIDYKDRSSLKSSHDVKLSILHLDRYKGRLDFLNQKLQSLIPSLNTEDVDIKFHNTSTGGRIDLDDYIRQEVNQIEIQYPHGIRRIGIVSCGPAKFNDICRRTSVELQDKIKSDTIVSYITDPFDW